MLWDISHAVLEKRRKTRQEASQELCRPWEDLMDALLELPGFSICSQTPYFSRISRVQTSWIGERDLEFGKDKWVGNAPVRAAVPRGLSNTPCTSYHTDGLSQKPPAGSGPCLSQGNDEESSSRAAPPAQLFMSSPVLFINLLIQEQLLPSRFRFDKAGFSFLHLQMTCLSFRCCYYNNLGKICHLSEILVTWTW